MFALVRSMVAGARLVSTELIKLIDYRTDLPPVLGVGIDIVQIVSKRRKFKT
jgi:hypothetical protein